MRLLKRVKAVKAAAFTRLHTSWLGRRSTQPLRWVLPLAVLVAALNPR